MVIEFVHVVQHLIVELCLGVGWVLDVIPRATLMVSAITTTTSVLLSMICSTTILILLLSLSLATSSLTLLLLSDILPKPAGVVNCSINGVT